MMNLQYLNTPQAIPLIPSGLPNSYAPQIFQRCNRVTLNKFFDTFINVFVPNAAFL